MLRQLAILFLALSVLPATAAESAKVRQKLYVTNSQGNDVSVIDLTTNKTIARIEVGEHPHGIAAPAAQDQILVSIEGSKPGQLVWIDPRSDQVTHKINIGPAPNQLAVTPDGKFAYVPCSDGYWDVVQLGKNEGKVVNRIFTGGRPHNTLCSANGQHIYLAPMGDSKKITIIDVATQKPAGEISFSNVIRPVALSKDGKRFFANIDGLIGFEEADLTSRKVVQRVAAELTDEQKAVVSRSHGIDIRPDQKELWTCDVEHHEVQVFDITGKQPKQIAKIPMGGKVYWLTFSPDGKNCYVSVRSQAEIAVVDTASKKITARLPVGKEPKRLMVVSVPEK